MGLSELLSADVVYLINTDDFAQSVTYTEPDGTTTTLDAVVYDERTEQQERDGVFTYRRMRSVSFATTDLTTVNARGTMTIGGTEYSITPQIQKNDQITTVELERHEIAEHVRPGYRTR